jgi:hypothetical protein
MILEKFASDKSDRNHPKYVRKTDHNCHSSKTDFLHPLTHINTPRLVVRMLKGWRWGNCHEHH